MEWLTRPDTEDELHNIDWLITVFTGNKKDDGNPEPSINSWEQPVGALNDHLKKKCNLKGALVLCPYRLTNGLK